MYCASGESGVGNAPQSDVVDQRLIIYDHTTASGTNASFVFFNNDCDISAID